MTPSIKLTIDGHRATLTLMREVALNRLREADLKLLEALLEQIDAATDVRVVILTGSGTKCFSAGFEIGERESADWEENQLERSILRLEAARPVVICALNGSVYGGACELALACDFRIATENTILALPEINLGSIPGSGGTQRVAKIAGLGRAKDMIMRGRHLTASEALDWGLLTEVVSEKDLNKTVDQWIKDMKMRPTVSLAKLKKP